VSDICLENFSPVHWSLFSLDTRPISSCRWDNFYCQWCDLCLGQDLVSSSNEVQTPQDCFDSQTLAYAHQFAGGLFCSQPGFSLSPLFRIWHVTFGQSFLGRLTSSATLFSFWLFINPSISLVEDSIRTPLFLTFITRSGLILLSLRLTDFVRTSFIFSDVFIVLASLVKYTRVVAPV
jgi:hypothetical protein